MSPDPAVSRLSREEWNAAYFLGLEAVFRHDYRGNFSQQVKKGVCILESGGYRVRGRTPATGPFPGPGSAAENDHSRSCRELADGSFDTVGRMRSAVSWLGVHAPSVSTRWLQGILDTYDRVHSARAGDQFPAVQKAETAMHPSRSTRSERMLHG